MTATDRKLMEVVIVGHVDHGKSTLVGRLLHDTGSIPQDKYEKIARICREQGKAMEYAFLLDAFEEEQKQGITIDVSRVRFSTPQRDYLLIDTPGHKEFLKNMFSGASRADAALILVDAEQGICEQSRQHAYLLSLLGIRQAAVVVSKMDRVGYSRGVFDKIVSVYEPYLSELGIKSARFIPVNSVDGDNIFSKSANMNWFSGLTVCEALDLFEVSAGALDKPFRMCVQDVYKFDHRRIIAGRIESGRVSVGDEVIFSPGNKRARVNSVEQWPESGTVKTAALAGESASLVLDRQLFVERGAVMSHEEHAPYMADKFAGSIFWLGQEPLDIKKEYVFRLGTQELSCRVEEIESVLCADGSERTGGELVHQYEAARITIRTRQLAVFDDFTKIALTGRFVIVDGNLVCGGGIAELNGFPNLRETVTGNVKSRNIHWHFTKIAEKEREHLYGHSSAVVWLTGLSGAGKSTVAVELEKRLISSGVHSYILDGDNMRYGLNSNLGFSAQDRAENIRRVGEVAKLFAEAGLVAISAFISPFESGRRQARERIREKFIEVYLDCPLSVCEERDVKGLYAKARKGEISEFTGISSPFEAPERPELHLRTDELSVGECVDRIIECLIARGVIEESSALLTSGR